MNIFSALRFQQAQTELIARQAWQTKPGRALLVVVAMMLSFSVVSHHLHHGKLHSAAEKCKDCTHHHSDSLHD